MTARQAYYTSSATGLSRYPGFQFVARSAGLRDADADAVARYLLYSPPPGTPPEPEPDAIERLPVAFGYIRTAAGPTLTCCRYSGRDYAGRPGNYFAHAVVAGADDLGATRPIEFWRADWWASAAGTDEPELPAMDDLLPGDAIDPDTVQAALAGRGEAGYRLVARLVDGAARVLDHGAGRLILIGDNADDVAVWIAAVSYSLPGSQAADLSFLTYSAEPERTDHRIVGTTPGVRLSATGAAQCFDLRRSAGEEAHEPSIFAAAVARCWRDADLVRIDSLCDLVGLAAAASGADTTAGQRSADRDAACTLALACDGEPVPADRAQSVARLIRRWASDLPEAVWAALRNGQIHDYEVRLAGWRAAGTAGRPADADLIGMSCVVAAIDDRTLRAGIRNGGRLSADAQRELSPRLTAAAMDASTLREVVELCGIAEELDLPLEPRTVSHAAAGATRSDPLGLREARTGGPERYLDPIRSGVLAGLNESSVRVIAAVLDAATCTWFGKVDWRTFPRVGRQVLVLQAEGRNDYKVATVRHILALSKQTPLDTDELADALARLWAARTPTTAERAGLLDIAETATPDAQAPLAQFIAAAWNSRPVQSEREYQLAERLWRMVKDTPTTRAAADTCLIVALYQLSKRRVLTVPNRWFETFSPHADGKLATAVADGAVNAINHLPAIEKAQAFSTLDPALPGGIADRVRRRLAQMPYPDAAAVARLAHFAIALHRRGRGDPAVDEQLARLLVGQHAKVRKELARLDKEAAKTLDLVVPEPRDGR